jgi:hypothetical protein
MATIGATYPSFIDFMKRTDPSGKIDPMIVEILDETNEILGDMSWVECNDGQSHKTTVRTGIPDPTWRQLYQGVTPVKSTTAQISDACGLLENWTHIDAELAKMNNNSAGWRISEERPVIEGINQGLCETLFYGNTAATPEKFMGLAPRYNTRTASTAQSADNVIHGGGSGSTNTSVWLIGWGPHSCHMIYPKGSPAGLEVKDLGEETAYDSNSRPYRAMRSQYIWRPGFTVRDWRYIVRIANIDVTTLTKNAGSGSDLIDLMTQATELAHNAGSARYAFYCNRTVRGFLRRQINNKSNMLLSLEQFAGKSSVPAFDGIPIRRCDQLLNTEATVTT